MKKLVKLGITGAAVAGVVHWARTRKAKGLGDPIGTTWQKAKNAKSWVDERKHRDDEVSSLPEDISPNGSSATEELKADIEDGKDSSEKVP